MASTSTRGQIVLDALSLAGRSTELKGSCNGWLNYWLKHVGINFRFPELRKVGSVSTLSMGSATAALPADMGAGMANQGMIFGPDNKPLQEKSYEEFVTLGGFKPANTGTGRPDFYLVDEQAGVFRFSCPADQAYSFTPIYFMLPLLPSVDSSADSQTIWLDDDLLAVQGLILMIYQFKEDPREAEQEAKVEMLLNRWKREVVKSGGTSRILPSPARFKTVRFGGFGGFGP